VGRDDIVAVIDWQSAALGDPLADLAVTRLDLLWAFGPDAMAALTAGYAAHRPVDLADVAIWDLVAALRPAGSLSAWAADWAAFGRPDVTTATMRSAHHWFVDHALARLAP
jgi:aminoglycoside phosphotransferase (APT) family kinase protein